MQTINCLLWDFGDTLCNERFIWGSGPEWLRVYESFDDPDGPFGKATTGWNQGTVDLAQFAQAIAPAIRLPADEVIAHMQRQCHRIEFFPYAYALFQANVLSQAIVTVNPDLFSNTIVPAYHLDRDCDVIVSSWEEGTEDKRILCTRAIERVAAPPRRGTALLIDNKRHNIDAWLSIGGAGYHFISDEQFHNDLGWSLSDGGRDNVAAAFEAIAERA